MTRRRNPSGSWVKHASLIVVVAIVAVAAYFLVTDLAKMNKDVEVLLDKEGKVAITVRADDSFADVLKNAIAKDSGTVEAILAGNQYYSLTSAQLVDELRKFDASQSETQEVSEALRRLLWDLQGPFSPPGTLRGADERMIRALDDLDEALQEAKEASVLLTELWRLSLERKGVFKPRLFHASIEVIPGIPTEDTRIESVLACPGSMLVGRVLFIQTRGSMKVEVSHNASLFHCDPPAFTAAQMLAGGRVRLGLSESAFRKLVDPDGQAGIGDGRNTASFEIYPRGLAARIM